jgi:hypothetical protein
MRFRSWTGKLPTLWRDIEKGAIKKLAVKGRSRITL